MRNVMRMIDRAMGMALAALVIGAGRADAQAVTLAGGARTYDEASAATVALRTEFPLPGPLRVEFAGSVADPVDEAPRAAAGIIEAQLQVEAPFDGPIKPYVGGGIGAAQSYTSGEEDDGPSTVYVLGAGLRFEVSGQLSVVLDARWRDFGNELDDDHADYSVGLRYQFLPRDRPRFRGAP
jgi:opacity protein-like surface antigen